MYVIFRYICTNTKNLVLHLSYLVRLDCFSKAFNWWVIALNSCFVRNMHKNALFLLKNCKKSPKAGVLPPDPLAFRRWGSAPRPPIPHWEFLTTPLLNTILLMLIISRKTVNINFLSLLVGLDERNWVGAQDSSHW